jgi:DNA-binding transcriptional LysR family regulator
MEKLKDAADDGGGLSDAPRGYLKVATGVGFGISVLAEQLPMFLQHYSDVHVTLDLANQPVDR